MFKFYSEEIIEEVRLKNDIVDVVSEYVKLEKKGKYLFGICPFHKEKTASFSVTPSKQMFYCYSCGKGGNVFQFIMNAENLDYVDAIKYLADRAKILLAEEESEEVKEGLRIKKAVTEINTCAARFFHDRLNNKTESHDANKYLMSRGLNGEIIKKFGIGYSPVEWDSLYKHLIDEKFELADIIKSGLIIQNKNGGFFDRFRNRIMFPIFDVRGNVIGFGGRSIDSSMPKYVNSPETCVYSKGKNLYGLNIAKKYSQNRLLVVEGYMDVVSLHQYGIVNVVASLGTALTEGQGFLLKKYAKEVVISYDADIAGQAAAIRGLDILNNIGCNIRVLSIPDEKDPDDYVRKHGGTKFKALIENSASLVDYKIQILKSDINMDTTEGKIEFLEKTAQILTNIENSIELELYIKKIAKEYGISDETLLREVAKKKKPSKNLKSSASYGFVSKKAGNEVGCGKDNMVYYEQLILALLCEDNNLFRIVKEKISLKDFSNEDNQKIANILFNKLNNKERVVIGELFSLIDLNVANGFSKVIQEYCNFEDKEKAILDILKKIEINKLDTREKEIIELLSNNKTNDISEMTMLKQELNLILVKKKTV